MHAGRIGVLGGSLEYAGAPYYAAEAAMRCGADLSHIFCAREAAVPIKSYSPELIVIPIFHLESVGEREHEEAVDDAWQKIRPWLGRIEALVVGPGLGRSALAQDTAARVVQELRSMDIPLVLDADGLWLASQRPEVIRGHKGAVLTPNVVEFRRLWRAADLGGPDDADPPEDQGEALRQLSAALEGVTILRKGPYDIVGNDRTAETIEVEGSPRRCGGQGDVLCGALATFLGWARRAVRDGVDPEVAADEALTAAAAAAAASAITRQAAKLAFESKGRSMTTPDLLERVGQGFAAVFPERYFE